MPRPRLGRGFSPSRWLRRAEGLQRITEGGNGQEWILARGLCAYTTLDGAAVPSRKRQNYAQMAIARWAPFPDAQSLVEWVGDRAMVWAWSKSQVLSAGVDDAPLPVPRRIVPESLYRGGPQADGQELVAMDQGYEGRVWQQGFLAAAMDTPVSVGDLAGEGGAWGMALLAQYLRVGEGSLAEWLAAEVFAGADVVTLDPAPSDVEGFDRFMGRYRAGLPVERAAIDLLG